jgi:ketol-acid reductoisomerase
MKLSTEKDVTRNALAETTVAVIGYGSQGRAHARNLRDSGHTVIIGLRPGGQTSAKARADGFRVIDPVSAAYEAGLVAMLCPDMCQPEVYEAIETALKPGSSLLFAHGFNVHFEAIKPREDIDVMLVAPKGPGDLVRRQYEQGRGVPCLRAVHQDASGEAWERALSYAHGIGGTRGGVVDTTFREETETDLFGEQAVLCGGISALVMNGFETLVEAGYQPEVAYFECLHELKLIVDLLQEGGLEKMYEFISETATYGDLVSGPRVVDEHSRQRMQEVLGDIQDGSFARNWIAEHKAGLPEYRRILAERAEHPMEVVGRKLRARMSWLNEHQQSEDDEQQPRGERAA